MQVGESLEDMTHLMAHVMEARLIQIAATFYLTGRN